MGEAEFRKLAQRLEELERINHRNERAYRKWKRIGVALLGCTLIVAITGAADQKPAIVEAKEFVLRDESKFILRLAGDPIGRYAGLRPVRQEWQGPSRDRLEPRGRGQLESERRIGNLACGRALRPDGTPGIGLFGTKGQIRASLDIGRDGTSGFNVYDDAGKLRAAMALRPDATPALGLFDEEGASSIRSNRQPSRVRPRSRRIDATAGEWSR